MEDKNYLYVNAGIAKASNARVSDTPFGACSECGELLNEEEAPKGTCFNCDTESAYETLF